WPRRAWWRDPGRYRTWGGLPRGWLPTPTVTKPCWRSWVAAWVAIPFAPEPLKTRTRTSAGLGPSAAAAGGPRSRRRFRTWSASGSMACSVDPGGCGGGPTVGGRGAVSGRLGAFGGHFRDDVEGLVGV